ncbi:MAG: iron chelate uptake ABC transporter family permease subunit [Psychroflexus sp.]|nr:iron chelate uptake ABC transporter family permease subunit [Psychroflexus sp.]MDN6310324.1 iron chelate uptake ABC transporter family permease subunit [Psychroflexus sp.]
MPRKKIYILSAITSVIILAYLFTFTGTQLDYVLPRRGYKILAMLLISCCIATASIIFQTITANRILTPSIMGFESVYVLFQTILVFIYGDQTFQAISAETNFLLSVLMMIGFALLLYFLIFKKDKNSVYFLLLVGLIMGALFRSFTSFFQMLIDPNEFFVVQNSMFASFNNVNTKLLGISAIVLVVCLYLISRYISRLNVLSLGKEHAINLGINYNKLVKSNLIIIAIMVSISTALIGPITFLGILVANLSYEYLKTYKHTTLIIGGSLITCIAVIGGDYLVEHLFDMSTTISIVINFVGGLYFLYLLLKKDKPW